MAKQKVKANSRGQPVKPDRNKVVRGDGLTRELQLELQIVADELGQSVAKTKRMAVEWFLKARTSAKELAKANLELERVEKEALEADNR